jgi:hypothetical protein
MMTIRLAAILLAAMPGIFAAVQKNPANCSSRPCTYTLTCASAQCTSTEAAEVQSALDDAQLGDTIILQAGRRWDATSTSRFIITGRAGSGYLTIRSSHADKLPPMVGARVTRHHLSAMPTLAAPSGVNIAVRLNGGTNPAKNIRFVGIHFTAISGANFIVEVGGNTSSITQEAHLPDDIYFEKCINTRSEWTATSITSNFAIRANRLTIQDSFLQGPYDPSGAERQNIGITICLDCRILNNALFDAAGENLFFGGTGRPYDSNPTSSGEVAYNAIVNHKERIPTLAWTPFTRYFAGVIARNSGAFYRATASCTSGATFTTEDNGCNWVQASDRRHMKNQFEIKDAAGLKIHHNLFDGFWLADGGGADQYENTTYKVSGCPINSGSNCQGMGPWNGVCSTNGTEVTSSSPLPAIFHCDPNGAFGGAICNVINIDGTDYNIANFDLSNPNRLFLTSSAGIKTNVNYTFGRQTYSSAWNRENQFEHNVVRNGPQPWQQIQTNGAYHYHIGHYRVRHNLFYRLSCAEFAQVHATGSYGCGSWGNNTRSMLLFAQVPYGTVFENNTIVDLNDYTYTMNWHGGFPCRGVPRGTGDCLTGHHPTAGDTIWRNNIIARGSSTAVLNGEAPAASGTSVISSKICEGGCSQSQWSGNIIAGAPLSGFPAGTYNLCPDANSCTPDFGYSDPVYGRLFVDYVGRNYQVRTGHFAQKGGYGGAQIGADWKSLPLITRPTDGGIGVEVQTASATATLRWRINAAMKHLRCTVEASSSADMDNPIGDLDALAHGYAASMDEMVTPLERRITIGTRNPLSPNTTYFYRVHCGSVEEGEFTTAAP